ncbi:MAG: DNA polymerase I [Oscillospiraceae bacterium]|nr:DNA polymerase I [Oscillospiraceae bacterium]
MRLMVLDGNSLLNRAFYGVKTPLSTGDGQPTGALMGFVNILQKLLSDYAPEALCVTFDLPVPTFRHKLYDGYKATRKPMPEELASQLPLCRALLDAMRVRRYELAGYEADDLIGTISRLCDEAGWGCDIVTGDRDSFQLIGPRVQVLHVSSRMGRTATTPYDEQAVRAEYGLTPDQLIDLKALMGDASDNIPGVPGVGEKTALTLMHRFGSLAALYENLAASDLRQTLKDKLTSNRDIALLSRTLALIDRFVPLPFAPEENRRVPFDAEALAALLAKLEFRKLAEKWGLPAAPALSTQHSALSTGAHAPPPTREVTAPAEMEALAAACRSAEVTALLVLEDWAGVAVCTGTETAVLRRMGSDPAAYERCLGALCAPDVPKAAHQVKAILGVRPEAGGFVTDTALAAYLLAPAVGKYPLTALLQAEFGALPADDGARAGCLHALAARQRAALAREGLLPVFETIELPLCAVLADMERVGCKVDRDRIAAFGAELAGWLADCEARIYEAAGENFNINSPKQLGEILFVRLGLPPLKKTKTGPSTDVEVLRKLRPYHPIIDAIMEYRQLSKLKSTYVDGLLAVAGPDGRVHTSFQMTATATGRLSSTEPNLQNIPVRHELGGALRGMFVPEDGWVLVDADYSQIELRVLAHIAEDATMRRAFEEGADIHTVTASQVFGVPAGAVTPLMRRHAKAVNFGIVYGISAFSLADDIGVSQAEARRYIDSYLENYAGVKAYMRDIVERARRDGFVTTLFGRRRWLPELAAANRNVRAFGERMALNTPIQGTAADIIKLAMVAVHRRLRAEGLRARLILQVHDELIVECPREEGPQVARLLTEEMEGVCPLNPPLRAESHVGENWLAAKGG